MVSVVAWWAVSGLSSVRDMPPAIGVGGVLQPAAAVESRRLVRRRLRLASRRSCGPSQRLVSSLT